MLHDSLGTMALFAAALAPHSTAQDTPAAPIVATHDGLQTRGPDYAASFERAGLRFTGDSTTPALGLSFERAYRRDGESLRGVGRDVAPTRSVASGDVVQYERGPVVEAYHVRDDGVEQTFTFAALPEGAGDLVVALRVQTDLEPDIAGGMVPRLTFGDRRTGRGIGIGEITGIDARGARSPGTMRYADGLLELTLPASFVDQAALPLVLDPLIGSQVLASSWYCGGLSGIDAAHNEGTDLFMVAWTGINCGVAEAASHGAWTSAQRVDRDGAMVGAQVCVECDTFTISSTPRIGNVEGAGAFLVLSTDWWFADWIGLDKVEAGGGAFSKGNTTFSQSRYDYDVGGSATARTTAVVVYTDGGGVAAWQVELSGNRPVRQATQRLTPVGSGAQEIRIASTGGDAERYLVVWEQGSELWGAVLDPDLVILDQGRLLDAASGFAGEFDMDGDGSTWLVTYTRGGAPSDVWALPVTWNAGTGTADLGRSFAVAASGASENTPSVAYTDGSFLVGYRSSTTGQRLVALDPISGVICETASVPRFDSLGAQGNGDRAVIGWGGYASVSYQSFRADDGQTLDLGGGCGNGGEATGSCAVRGNAEFQLRLRNAGSEVPAVVALGVRSAGLPCGPCTLYPDALSAVFVPAGSTTPQGSAGVTLPIPDVPSVVGAAIVEQWVTIGGSSCLGAFALSNGLEVQIQ
ncbi:MAG: hypothetical protein AAF628_18100 [Planctomycetota bacterium]